MNTANDLVNAYSKFLGTIHRVAAARLRKKSEDHAAYEELSSLLDEIIKRLGNEEAIELVLKAAQEEDQFVVEALTREMRFYNRLAEGDQDGSTVAQGEVVKTSFEKLIEKLPKWMQKLLHILNEILQLIRP
jgi:hypothetical protein